MNFLQQLCTQLASNYSYAAGGTTEKLLVYKVTIAVDLP